MTAPSPDRQRAARRTIEELFRNPVGAFVIHYACESLERAERAGSPRITAIAARNLATGETQCFSIHAEVELARLGPVQALSRMDQLERTMLDRFYGFMSLNRTMRFVHWNMRDAVFGFAAIDHRYRVLGGSPLWLHEAQKLDLAKLMTDIYGTGYADKPHFETLAELNHLSIDGLIGGRIEAEAFHRGGYLAIQRSVLTKVRLIADIAHLVRDGELETNAGWWELNVGRVREACELFQDNPVKAFAGLAFACLSAGFVVVMKVMM